MLVENAGSNQAGPPVCYECKQPGHIHPDCPNLWGKPHINAACVEEMKRGDEVDHCPEVMQEDEPPAENKWGHSPHDEEEHLNGLDKDAPNQTSHYEWDEELNEGETPSFWANALSTPKWGYCKRKHHAVMHDVSNAARGSDHKRSKLIRLAVGVMIEGEPPLLDHCVHKRMGAR